MRVSHKMPPPLRLLLLLSVSASLYGKQSLRVLCTPSHGGWVNRHAIALRHTHPSPTAPSTCRGFQTLAHAHSVLLRPPSER